MFRFITDKSVTKLFFFSFFSPRPSHVFTFKPERRTKNEKRKKEKKKIKGKKRRKKKLKKKWCVCKSERDRYPCKNLNQSDAQSACAESTHTGVNRRFPEITGGDNLTVFSYSGRVKSPEWRWQRRRADLRHSEIFRHGPIIIYTSLPAGGTFYPICMSPTNSECLIGISDAFSAFCLRVSVILPTCSLYPRQKRAYSALHPHTGPYPKAVTECSPPDFRRSSISARKTSNLHSNKDLIHSR